MNKRSVSPEVIKQLIDLINSDPFENRVEDDPLVLGDERSLTFEAHPAIEGVFAVVRERPDDDIWDDVWIVEMHSAAPGEVSYVPDQLPRDDGSSFPPGSVMQEDKDGLFWAYAPTGDASQDEENNFPWRRTNLDYETAFKTGDLVFPVIFHANTPGGWTVMSPDGSIDEYWQAC